MKRAIRISPKTNASRLPGAAVVVLAVFLIFGAVFAALGIWSLVGHIAPDTIPGWPFVIIGSVMGVRSVLHGRRGGGSC